RGSADALELLQLLHGTDVLHEPARRDELHAIPDEPAQPLVRPHGEVMVLEADPSGEVARGVFQQVLPALLAVERGVHLALGLGHVAEVREEEAEPLADHAGAVGPRVAGEVADVHEVSHEQRVQLALAHQRFDAVRAGHAGPCRAPRRTSSASRYPSTPLPWTVPTQSSRMTERRRHSSRSSTADRCTSTAGRPHTSSASRIAYE